jgi:hypothetical protein
VTRGRSRPRFKPKTDDPVKTPQLFLKGFVKIDPARRRPYLEIAVSFVSQPTRGE